jgi:histidyl-tRNA synthetase
VPYVALAGESEMAAGNLAVKNQKTGEQQLLTVDQIVQLFV